MYATYAVIVLALLVVVAILSRARRGSQPIHPPQYPQTVFLTYKTVAELPNEVVTHIRELNPGFTVHAYGDPECVAFLHQFFGAGHARFFLDIPDGPIKADFWRACVIYVYGGVYLDADSRLTRPLAEFVIHDIDLCTSGSMTRDRVNPIVIVAKPKNPIIWRCIEIMLSKRSQPYNYWRYSICPALFQALNEFIPNFKHNGEGVYRARDGRKVQLLHERPWRRTVDARTMWKGCECIRNHSPGYANRAHKFVKK